MEGNIDIQGFINRQLAIWPEAAEAYNNLKFVQTRTMNIDGYTVMLQHNPARAQSSTAKTDPTSIAQRACFLCKDKRPHKQLHIDIGEYEILVNPYPIFPRHLTIPLQRHQPQRASGRIKDMVTFATLLKGMTVFYNGPRCGASAPDHHHFQAGPTEMFPIWQEMDRGNTAVIPGTLKANTPDEAEQILASLPHMPGNEPDVNILARTTVNNQPEILIIPRRRHRPSCYGTEGDGCVLLSPASVDMGGLWILPREHDFNSLTETMLKKIIAETAYTSEELHFIINRNHTPYVSVGIVSANAITATLNGPYSDAEGTRMEGKFTFHNPIEIKPLTNDCTFTLHNVKIGIGFHWEQSQAQTFKGSLRIINDNNGKLVAINDVEVEEYLLSVITSEMNADAPEEFLKSHAVISRSWLIAQIKHSGHTRTSNMMDTPHKRIKWYDHDDHTLFDVCADDHCQRYQGFRPNMPDSVTRAVKSTRGIVLMNGEELCDARFSKCCGGITERFSTCWDNKDMPYLVAKRDSGHPYPMPDLTAEPEAEKWCMSHPDAFCANPDAELLKQVLNGYDLETPDFYRWQVDYSAEELSTILKERTGMDFGSVLEISALHRGPSGRIDLLEIRGTKHTMTIGKELEIRKSLSKSHLYSSAFVVKAEMPDSEGIPQKWHIHGAGWGHGVGLCQIGAAAMAEQGYSYREILAHYYPGSHLINLY